MINSNSEKRICKSVRSILTASLAFSAVPVMALSDYVPTDKASADRYDLHPNTKVSSLTVKFKDTDRVRQVDGALRSSAANSVAPVADKFTVNSELSSVSEIAERLHSYITPTFTDREGSDNWERNDKMRARGEARSGVKLADLNNFYKIVLMEDMAFEELEAEIDRLNQLGIVEIAHADPPQAPAHYDLTMPPGATLPSSSVQGSQGYLSNTNDGVHAVAGWHWPGAKGDDVKVVDVEWAINPYHEDLPPFDVITWWSSLRETSESHHGTAVMGVMVAEDQGFGITGIASNATWGFESTRYCFFGCYYDTGRALNNAISEVEAGDVLVIEVHVQGPDNDPYCDGDTDLGNDQCDYLPAEWQSSVFAATQTAVANGINVVAAAGNGSVDLDDPLYNNYFDTANQDSGAILVGASESDSTDGVMWFSNHGSRVTARGWGEDVGTLGYGSHSDYNKKYTGTFNGTSSATPQVAGAALSIQGAAKKLGFGLLSPSSMRTLLSSTGSPQTHELIQNIGEMPNVHAAITEMQSQITDCNLNGGNAQYGGFGIHDATFRNNGTATLNGWATTIDFNGALPSIQWTSGASAEVYGDKIVVYGSGAIAPGSSASFSLGGQFNGPTFVNITCD